MKRYKIQYGGMLFESEERKALHEAIERNYWPAGEEVNLMEQEAAAFLGVKHGVLANSGSSACLLALSSLELPHGSEVIIPATTFPTVFNAILQCGLRPVVVDSKLGTYNLEPSELEEAIGPNTKAVICVNAVGSPVDYEAVRKVCDKHNLVLIQDNCDGFGGSLKGKKLETYADVSFTSFHAAHIVSMGQGGGVFTNDPELARKVRMYRDWGRQSDIVERTNNTKWPDLPADYDARFIYEKVGYNLGPLDIQAAMGRVQLKRTEEIKAKRKANFDYLYEHLSKHKDLLMPRWVEGAEPSWFSFPLSYKNRGALVSFLEEKGIETRSLFAGVITKHPAYRDVKWRLGGDLTEANQVLTDSFWVSCHPRMTQEDREYMVKTFDDFLT